MNGFGRLARDSGHSRVPLPPERMTGIIVAVPCCLLFATFLPRSIQRADQFRSFLLQQCQILTCFNV